MHAVSLTRVKAHRQERKRDLATHVRDAVDSHARAFVFTFDNMRSARFKDLRSAWADSRFFLGKNRVMAKGLGEDSDSEHRPGLHRLASDLNGAVGLLFTDHTDAEVRSFFDEYAEADYARAGFIPAAPVSVAAGRLDDMPHTMFETLSKLGMPVKLDRGVVVLPTDFELCAAGKPLTPEQSRLLKLFGHQLAVFRLRLLSGWDRDTGKYTSFGGAGALGALDDGDDDDDGSEVEDSDSEEEAPVAASARAVAASKGLAGSAGAAGRKSAAAAAAAPAPAPKTAASKAAPATAAAAGAGGKAKGKARGGKSVAATLRGMARGAGGGDSDEDM